MKRMRMLCAVGLAVLLVGSATATLLVWQDTGSDATEGTAAGVEDASIRGVTDEHGSVHSIRGIEGIDTVILQNLETVLRMQDRPQEEQGKGNANAAAGLMAREMTEPLEDVPDARDVHLEFEMEGS